jgi:hypothetical protein
LFLRSKLLVAEKPARKYEGTDFISSDVLSRYCLPTYLPFSENVVFAKGCKVIIAIPVADGEKEISVFEYDICF